MRAVLSCVFLLALSLQVHAAERPDVLVADFEGDTYGDWKVEGEAFGTGPAHGTLPNQMPVTGYLGKGYVNSYHGGDDTTGTLTSPPFKLERKYLRFLIGGGKYPGKTCMNLLVDGKIVRTATGPNDKPGGSEQLDWQEWNVTEFAGKTATLQIVDHQKGGWGHITVDHILQTDRHLPVLLANVERTLLAEKRYLNLPVRTGAPKRRVSVLQDGKTVREFEIELADDPDFWTFLDQAPFRGKTLVLRVDQLPEDSRALAAIEQGDDIKGAENLYREKLRPQFHFSSRRGWLNDPNGLVYLDGEWHLYYQHNPYGWDWGNMHWGHAVSKDLVHWQELPIALYPQRFGDWCFSGSAVVDRENTSGFRKGDADVLVAAYTSTGRGECIVHSNDRGRTFTEYEGNPVVKHQGRDPRLLWHAPTKRWVMAVYDEREKSQAIAFYTSPDLKKWEYASRIEGYFECPELFELPVDGGKETRWVLYAADGAYAIGSFDGKTFTPEGKKQRFNYGNCFYASQTFSNVPANDGRRIQIGWGQVKTPGMSFNQMMLFPTELTLRKTDDGLRLCARPVREIEKLHDKHVDASNSREADTLGDLLHIRVELKVPERPQYGPPTGVVTLITRGIEIVCDTGKETLTCGQQTAPVKPVDGKIRLEVLVDRTSVEIFANDGLVYMTVAVTPDPTKPVISGQRRGGLLMPAVRTLDVFSVRSAWPVATNEKPEHRVLGADKGHVAIVKPTGEVEWEYPNKAECHDLWLLPNGNVLMATGRATVAEVSPDKKVVWSYEAKPKPGYNGRVEVHAFQRLDNGLTMVAESGNARIVEVDPGGKIVHEVPLTVEHPDPHRDTRMVRKLENGHYLVCHEGDGKVREYDATGKVIWSYTLDLAGRPASPGHGPEGHGTNVYGAIRLPDGNTLIAGGNNNRVLEVNPKGEIVWSIDQKELPGITLAWVTTLHRLPNGNTVIGNCHAGPDNPQLIEVTRDKKVVWTFKDFETFGNGLAATQLLDLKGKVIR